MKYLFTGIVLVLFCGALFSQADPGDKLELDLLTTYGNMTENENGALDISRSIFFVLPDNFMGSFFVRVFDPDCGGAHDSSSGLWETNTEFEVFGGAGCVKLPLAGSENQHVDKGSGILLQEKLFADEPGIDGTWVTFGPFTIDQGEKLNEYNSRFFKLLVGGKTGNDANQYAVFLSSSDEMNKEVSGAAMYDDVYAFNEDLQGGKYSYSVVAEPLE